MSTNLGNYQATNETMDDRSPLPPATYLAMIVESEVKPTQRQDGTIISFTFEVVDGEFRGRKFWTNINYSNPSQQAQQIGRKELNTIMAATRVATVQDTTQLHNIPMLVDVSIEQSDGYKPRNNCENYHFIEQQDNSSPDQTTTGQPVHQQAQTQQPVKQAAPSNNPDWSANNAPADDTPSWAK